VAAKSVCVKPRAALANLQEFLTESLSISTFFACFGVANENASHLY
jgi:hypothetical protein